MSHLSRQATVVGSAGDWLDRLRETAALFVSSVQRRRSLMQTRAILDQLNETQLRDIGIGRWTGYHPRSTIPVEVGLITNLLSMR